MTSIWAASLLLRRLRAERGVLAVLFGLIAATTFVFAAAPRLFNRVADEGLGYAMAEALPIQRDLALALTYSIPPDTDAAVGAVEAYGQRHEATFPAAVERQIASRALRVSTVRMLVADPPVGAVHLVLRYQDGVTDATRLVAGRWPVDRGMPLLPAAGHEQAPPAIVEVALSRFEADQMGMKVGDQFAISPDASDSLVRAPFVPSDLHTGQRYGLAPAAVEIVGLFEPLDPAADDWAGDGGLLQATVTGLDPNFVFFGTAYVAAAAYPSLASGELPFRYEWHYGMDPHLDADQAVALRDGIRSLVAGGAASADANPGQFEVRTGLADILDRYAAQRALTEAILSLAAIGPIALAGAAIGLVGVLLVARRRAGLLLARGRGASGALVLGAQLWEAVLVAGSAAVVGFLAATQLAPGRASGLSSWLALAVAAAAVVVLVSVNWRAARRPLGLLERDDPPVLRVPPRRLVIELTIVGIAVAAAFLLRQRGLTAVPPGGVARFDPLLAAVPVLGGLAAGIVVMRLTPLPIRAAAWLAARGRDLVPVLGLRTTGRLPTASTLPLLVLMLSAAFGAFASVVASSIDRGQTVASALQVGADYRIETAQIGNLPSTLDLRSVPGVQSAASAIVDGRAPFTSFPFQHASVYLDAVDAPAYADVAAGTGADPLWPRAFLAAPLGADPGSDANPIPAMLSSQLPAGSANLGPGGTFHATVAQRALAFRVVERRVTFPGLGSPPSFVVVPLSWIRAAFAGGPVPVNVMWVRAGADVAGPLATALSQAGVETRVISRYEAFARLHDAPLVAAVGAGYGLALAVAAIYLALTFVGAMALSARRRTQDLAYLRTLGVSARQALALTAVEQAPTVLLALVPGVALGVLLAVVLEPGLGLATFIGASGIPLYVDWPALAVVVVALVGVVAAAVAVGTWLARRPGWTDALRIGEA